MVMVNSWTTTNPSFKLVSQEVYSEKYLWKKNGKFDAAESNKKIEEKIKSQYVSDYGDMKSMNEKTIENMNAQIAKQKKDLDDRIVLLNKTPTEAPTETPTETPTEEPTAI